MSQHRSMSPVVRNCQNSGITPKRLALLSSNRLHRCRPTKLPTYGKRVPSLTSISTSFVRNSDHFLPLNMTVKIHMSCLIRSVVSNALSCLVVTLYWALVIDIFFVTFYVTQYSQHSHWMLVRVRSILDPKNIN